MRLTEPLPSVGEGGARLAGTGRSRKCDVRDTWYPFWYPFGESAYDIFVRWKPLAEQPVGWEPDLDDGVRLNFRPFVTANVLRKRPGIKWDKDRGKDPESAPWFPVFHGDRINDHHLALAEKLAAGQAGGSG